MYFKLGLEPHPPKKSKNQGNGLCKTEFQVAMDLKRVQKLGRDERMQEDYPTTAVYYFADVR